MRKNRLTVLLSVVFLLASSFVSLADNVASASDAVYVHPEPLAWSEAVEAVKAERAVASASETQVMTLDLTEEDYGIMPLSSVGTVTNTVDRTGISVICYGANGESVSTFMTSDGKIASVSTDFVITKVDFVFHSTALPAAGTYAFSMDFTSDFSYNLQSVFFFSRYDKTNVASSSTSQDLTNYSFSSGDFYLPSTIVGINGTSFTLAFKLKNSTLKYWGGSARFRFVTSSGTPEFSSPGSSSSEISSNYQSGVTSSLGSIGDTLEEIVETISLQLEALWNQMYNYIHLPEYEKLEQIRQAIENIDLDLDIDFDAVVAKIQEQISNDNANTEKVTNGYDNSDINYENDRLSGALGRLSDTEHDVTDSASGHLDSFDFDDSFFADYIKPLEDISYFLSGIYVALGGLNIPIGFTLTLTIALLLIGYYRFKGGS